MRLFRVLTLSVMVAGCATLAFADAQPTPDPHVIINDPVGYFTDVGLEFTFTTNDSGGGFFSFTNDSGVTFANLELYVPDLPTSDMTCSGSAFAFCAVEPGEDGYAAVIDFWGGAGIPNMGSFTIDMGPSGWPGDAQFKVLANAPEPTSLSLLLTGCLPMAWRWRRNRQQKHRNPRGHKPTGPSVVGLSRRG